MSSKGQQKGRVAVYRKLTMLWTRFWMRFAGLHGFGRVATRLAVWFAPPHKARVYLARMNPHGYIAASVTIYHDNLRLAANVFIGEDVLIFQAQPGAGPVDVGDRVHIHRDVIIEVGREGSLTIGSDTHVQPRCQFTAYQGPIRIGCGVQIAPYCAFYSYDHSYESNRLVRNQPLVSKGGIVIEDDAWLGVGVTVLDGVRIGKGTVVGAGAVVTHDLPDGAIAAGVPARVIKMRDDPAGTDTATVIEAHVR